MGQFRDMTACSCKGGWECHVYSAQPAKTGGVVSEEKSRDVGMGLAVGRLSQLHVCHGQGWLPGKYMLGEMKYS